MSNWLRVIGGWMLDVLFGGAASDHLYRSRQGRQGRQVQGRAGTLTIVGTPHNQKQCEWGPDDSFRRGRCCMHLDHWRGLRSKFGRVSRPVSAEPFLSPVGPVSRLHYTARTDSTKQTLGNDMVAQGFAFSSPLHACRLQGRGFHGTCLWPLASRFLGSPTRNDQETWQRADDGC
jgi:hypothetical protein